MNIYKQNRNHVMGFGIFAFVLLLWFIYAGFTGWQLFNNDGNQQKWSSSGPGYHK